MEVVCLILGPMLASQPCSHAFWVLTSLHLLSFLLKMFFIILYILVLTDIDECANSSLNGCDQLCSNTIGSFACECNTGYQLNDDLMTCSGM